MLPRWLGEFGRRLNALVRRDRVDQDVRDELEYHVDLKAAEFERQGFSPAESRRRAYVAVGPALGLREESHDAWGWSWLETFVEDLRYGFRTIRTAPGFAATVILTLAIGTGAVTTVFSALYGVLLRPLPYVRPDRLVVMHETTPQVGVVSVSHPNYLDWKKTSRTFAQMASVYTTESNLSGLRQPQTVEGEIVSSNFLPMLGVHPVIGRDFEAADDLPHAAPVVMVSDALWRSQLGSDAGALGRTLMLDGVPVTIIAVLPAGFESLDALDYLQPLGAIADQSSFTNRGAHGDMAVLGRLADGATFEQARAEMTGIAAHLATVYPDSNDQYGVAMDSIRSSQAGDLEPTLWLLFGAVSFVLLIACANVANLLLIRGAARAKEIALRVTCGATRTRIVRQMLTESLALAVCGGVAGAVVAAFGSIGLNALVEADRMSSPPITMNGPVLVFTAVVVVLTTLLFGLAPAFYATRTNLQDDLREGSRTTSATKSQQRLRGALAASEIALALLLLVGAGLMTRSLTRLLAVDPGFRTDHVLTLDVSLTTPRYENAAVRLAFWRRMLESVRAIPGVESAAFGTGVPLTNSHSRSDITIEGMPTPRIGNWPHPDVHRTTPGYLSTLGVPLLRGRDFTEADDSTQPRVALISQAVADQFFKDADPIGKRMMFGHTPPANNPSAPSPRWITIVGVVGSTKLYGYEHPARLEVYMAGAQSPPDDMRLLVKSRVDEASLTTAIRSILTGIDPDQPVSRVVTMDQLRKDALSSTRMVLTLLGVFSGVALMLAVIGIYGVVSYGVSRRTRELGIRMALGAQSGAVLRMMLKEGATLSAIGLGVGLLLAVALTRLMSDLLFSVSALDPATFVNVALIIAVVAIVACYVPARRAIRVDPVRALRAE